MKSNNQSEKDLYRRIKLLGEGSFGKAYLVECVADKTLCVIKQVDLTQMREDERRETIKEARILEALRHPNIVKFREVYKTKNNRLCIVMDYADGGDLGQKIRDAHGNFSESQILDWFTQICLAIKHVHDRKIIHRDLKTQNIFLTKDGIIKLGDFGIARVLNHTREKCKTMVGTPYYLSPEIIDSRDYSFKTDVWSLGVILYELCALRPPFNAESLHGLALKIVRGQYNPLPDRYSSNAKNLVKTLLNIDPNKRPNIHEILKMYIASKLKMIIYRPAVVNRIRSVLSESVRNVEFSHTILHNKNFVNKDLQVPYDDDIARKKNQNQVVSTPNLRQPLGFLQAQTPIQIQQIQIQNQAISQLQKQRQIYQQHQPHSNYEFYKPNQNQYGYINYGQDKNINPYLIKQPSQLLKPSVSPLNKYERDISPINKFERDISPLLDKNVYIRDAPQIYPKKSEPVNNLRYEPKKSPLQRIQEAHAQLSKISQDENPKVSEIPKISDNIKSPFEIPRPVEISKPIDFIKPAEKHPIEVSKLIENLKPQVESEETKRQDLRDSQHILKQIREDRKGWDDERDKMKKDIQKKREILKKDKENEEQILMENMHRIKSELSIDNIKKNEQKTEDDQNDNEINMYESNLIKQTGVNEDANQILAELEDIVNDIEDLNQSQVINIDDTDILKKSVEVDDAISLVDDEEIDREENIETQKCQKQILKELIMEDIGQEFTENYATQQFESLESFMKTFDGPYLDLCPLVLVYEAMEKLKIDNLIDLK